MGRVAPHHSGLTPLEQHIVEKWSQHKVVNLVVATQSLAQGVNLPFDVSIVSFLKQTNPATSKQEAVPVSSVMKMIGALGAELGKCQMGFVWLQCRQSKEIKLLRLIVLKCYFFRAHQASNDLLGLAKLLQVAADAQI